MADALGTGSIDGYCVGEPWNTAAVLAGSGHIATVKAAIWRSSPEKVLGVQAAWAETHPEALAALLRALYRAAVWCADAANRDDLASMLSQPAYLARPKEWMLPALSGRIRTGGEERRGRGFLHSARQGGDLPVEEPRAVVLFADGPLAPDRPQQPRMRSSRARPIVPISIAPR